MKNRTFLLSIVVMVAGIGWVGAQDSDLSFFLTSKGLDDGANLDGLAGADAHCQSLAAAVGASGRTWRAYLSTTGGDAPINARDRIGAGPWTNANGVIVATDVDDLHNDNNKLSKENSIGEGGQVHNGRGDSPNRHDILTGSDLSGNAFGDGEDHSCMDWTSNSSEGSAQVGHHDRIGGGVNPTSWNNAHPSRGCSQADLQGTGGDGLYYCFAAD
jgi:hypothetical protein